MQFFPKTHTSKKQTHDKSVHFRAKEMLSSSSFKKDNSLITGTLMLTSAGLLTRIIGFFHRIYLSQLIGAKEMGIYQLIFPVYMVAFALCCHGIELALSQMIAARSCRNSHRHMVSTGIFFALSSSLLLSVILYQYADIISISILKEKNAAVCLRLMAPVLPFTALRCCLHGYYIGLKKIFVPAAGQLIEQLVRVLSVWLLVQGCTCGFFDRKQDSFTASLAVCGMVIGEISGTIYTYLCYRIDSPSPSEGESHSAKDRFTAAKGSKKTSFFLPFGRELLRRAIPLTGNKLSLTLASALESILIPVMLTKYYKNAELALSLYGVLTGMALPFITFPSTLTNSLSVMLLPTISQAHASGNQHMIHSSIKKTVKLCLSLGFTALILFFCFGKTIGTYVFHNTSAGDFLFILSFLCPFLYLASSGTSILNGLGLMKQSFFYHLISIGLRIGSILCLIPHMGIQGYLLGLLGSYLLLVSLQGWRIRKAI